MAKHHPDTDLVFQPVEMKNKQELKVKEISISMFSRVTRNVFLYLGFTHIS